MVVLNQGERPDLYYWRDSNGNEVDVIAEQGTGLLPIEMKLTGYLPDRFLVTVVSLANLTDGFHYQHN